MNNREEHRLKIAQFFGEVPKFWIRTDMEKALYAMSELEMWPDSVDAVSVEQSLLCWHVVNELIKKKFPKELWM